MLISLISRVRMSGSGLEVYDKRTRLDMKHFFTERVVSQWNRFSREVVDGPKPVTV